MDDDIDWLKEDYLKPDEVYCEMLREFESSHHEHNVSLVLVDGKRSSHPSSLGVGVSLFIPWGL